LQIGFLAFFFMLFLGTVVTTQQAMAGGPLMVGTTLVQGVDRSDGTTYGNPTTFLSSNTIAKVLPVYKGDQATFYYRLQNYDPFPIVGEVNAEYRYYSDFTSADKKGLSKDQYGPDILVGAETFDKGAAGFPIGGYRENCVFGIATCWAQYNSGSKKGKTLTLPITVGGPGSDIPGNRICAYVQTNPTLYDFTDILIFKDPIIEGLHKFNSHNDSFNSLANSLFLSMISLGFLKDFSIGDQMSCLEIAYNYDLTPNISLNNPGGGGVVDVTPNVTLKPKDPKHPATHSDKTEWRISQFFLPEGQDPSSQVRDSRANKSDTNPPCTFFASKDKAKDCKTPKWSNGTDAKGKDWRFDTNNLPMDGKSWLSSLESPGTIPKGYKVCYALSLSPYQPYLPGNDTSPYWRHSKVVCVTGSNERTPNLQVRGGDVRVGREFIGDVSPIDPTKPKPGIYTSTTSLLVNGTDGMTTVTFGSWVEYGALAPGPIVSFASASGFASASPVAPAQNACQKELNRLTFANDSSASCGNLKDSIGTIPDVVASLTSRTAISSTISGTLHIDKDKPGLYQNPEGTSLTIDAGTVTGGNNHSYIVYLPKGTVTITGNVTIDGYDTQPYTSIKDIPQLVIIAKNIKIDKSVNRIDAWLIATATKDPQGKDTDGVINTCASFSVPGCSQPLTINGPIMARELQPWRTTTYMGDCTTSQADLNADTGCAANVVTHANVAGMSAEIINLPASTLLWALAQASPAQARTTYTVEVPPRY